MMVLQVSLWPDLPAIFESLNDDTLTTTLQFVGNKSYRSFGGINKRCKEVYLSSGMTKETFLFGYAPLSRVINKIEEEELKHEELGIDWLLVTGLVTAVGKGVLFYNRSDVMDWAVQRQKLYLLKGICNIAAEEGRLDLLEKVWDDIEDEDDKRDVFEWVDEFAAHDGKLEVLKWIETKGLSIDKKKCAHTSACHGNLHILKWLQEEKDLELDGGLYKYAICGGHLHVMKWLREHEVDWDKDTFFMAAEEGNLEVMQWLHDEGCPWDLVPESWLKPEVLDWCRVNGYGDRIFTN